MTRTTDLFGLTKISFSKREHSRTIGVVMVRSHNPNRADTTVEAWLCTFVAGSPLQTALSAVGHCCPIAGRTILPKVSFDIPRGTTLETFASRSVRKDKNAVDDLDETFGKVNRNDWKAFCRLALYATFVTFLTNAEAFSDPTIILRTFCRSNTEGPPFIPILTIESRAESAFTP